MSEVLPFSCGSNSSLEGRSGEAGTRAALMERIGGDREGRPRAVMVGMSSGSSSRICVASVSVALALRSKPGRPNPHSPCEADPVIPSGDGDKARRATIDDLRTRIRSIEAPGPRALVPSPSPRIGTQAPPVPVSSFSLSGASAQVLGQVSDRTRHEFWELGEPLIDNGWLAGGLGLGLHEVKPGSPGDWAAAIGFALALAVRRVQGLGASEKGKSILWCVGGAWSRELGLPYAPALRRLGLDPAQLLLVEARRESEALWALEEGLRSRALVLAIGLSRDIALLPARRLALAGAAGGTPCLLLTPPTPLATSALTRWRIARAPSAPHPLDPKAPWRARWRLVLERQRHGPAADKRPVATVEWCDATHRFHMASSLADRAPEAECLECFRAQGARGRDARG